MDLNFYDVFAGICVALVVFLVLLILFEPGLKYRIKPRPLAIDSQEFLQLLGALCDAEVRACGAVKVLKNGTSFYAEELKAISQARESVNLEAYIFHKGKVAKDFVDALAERARSGVRVKLVVDAVGSLTTKDSYFKPLRDAGGHVKWYQPLRLATFKRWNNRTHRKVIVIDGRTAFCGGADIADEWLYDRDGEKSWRDTVFRFEGDVVNGLQSTFAENWLEASGKILADADYFPLTRDRVPNPQTDCSAIVVNSTPSAARGTRAHILYQTLMAYASKSLLITTPYFLPDRSTLCEILRAKERGVRVVVLVPGVHSDHLFTRVSSRRRYGDLLKAGVDLYEYSPSMIHAKTMVVDGIWSVVGSSNFDNRSLGLNDEVNVAIHNAALAGQLEDDFRCDLEKSRQISYEQWSKRPVHEKVMESFFRIFDRQI